MDWLIAGLLLIVAILLAPLWGWMWRDMRRRGGSGGGGAALLEINKIAEPSQRHVEEAKDAPRVRTTERGSGAGGPDSRPPPLRRGPGSPTAAGDR